MNNFVITNSVEKLKKLYVSFLESTNQLSYEAVRIALVANAAYDPYSKNLVHAAQLMQAEEYDEARNLIVAAMPNLLLSPRSHQMLSFVAEQTGDLGAQNMEAIIASKLCEGMLATGDGTPTGARLVSRLSDEYDLLRFLGKNFVEQTLHENGPGRLDCLKCSDGTAFWFDVTEQMLHLNRG